MQKGLQFTLVLLSLFSSALFCQANKPTVFVSILPVSFLANEVAGPFVEVKTLLPKGQNPGHFQPKISQLSELSQASIYFSLDLPFEKIILQKIKASHPSLKIVHLQEGLQLRSFSEPHHHDHDHDHEEMDEHESADSIDPHVWLNPENALKIAQKIQKEISELLPENRLKIEERSEQLQAKLHLLDQKIHQQLEAFEGKIFFVYHPAFGYFADRYHLKQVAVETNGKSPTPQNLKELILLAREKNVKSIFIQQQFNTRSAEILAEAIGAKVTRMDPLAEDYISNLEKMAEAIVEGLQSQ